MNARKVRFVAMFLYGAERPASAPHPKGQECPRSTRILNRLWEDSVAEVPLVWFVLEGWRIMAFGVALIWRLA